jgi:hypothetical protein
MPLETILLFLETDEESLRLWAPPAIILLAPLLRAAIDLAPLFTESCCLVATLLALTCLAAVNLWPPTMRAAFLWAQHLLVVIILISISLFYTHKGRGEGNVLKSILIHSFIPGSDVT